MNIKNKNLILLFFVIGIFIISCDCSKNPNSPNPDETVLYADAGNDQTIFTGSYAIFNPTKSTGEFNWFEWQQDDSNPSKVCLYSESRTDDINDSYIHKIGFDKEGIYRFKLLVGNFDSLFFNEGILDSFSKADEVVITVNPNPYKTFEDPNLEIIIRMILENQNNELTKNILLNLDSIFGGYTTPNDVSSLKGIEQCTNLSYVNLSLENISDISSLSNLTKLKALNLNQNHIISNLTPLADLKNLEYLDLNSNSISDISSLKNLTKLKYLDLKYNDNITDISSIKNMYELEELYFTSAGISDISMLTNFTKLSKIQFINSNISDISSLKNLKNLNFIRFWNNKITDIKPLVDNENINENNHLDLSGNPLNDKSINEYIPILQSRGVYVDW